MAWIPYKTCRASVTGLSEIICNLRLILFGFQIIFTVPKSSPSGYQAHSSDFGCHSKSELFKKPVIRRELNFWYFYRRRTFMCWTSWRPSDMFKRRPRGPTMTGYCIYINSKNLNIVGIWNLTFKIWKHLKYGIVEDCISNGLVFKGLA